VHTPDWQDESQDSVSVPELRQAVPSGMSECPQVPSAVSHTSSVQTLVSSQSTGAITLQVPVPSQVELQ
jgi:hypothetical protein